MKPTLLTGNLAEAEVINPTTTTTTGDNLIGPLEGVEAEAGAEADPPLTLGLLILLALDDKGKLLSQQTPLHLHLHAHLHRLIHHHLCKHHTLSLIDT